MCKYCEKKIRNLKNAKITPQTYIGKRFGNVVIIDCYWLYKSGRNRIYVDYKCDCGTIKTSNIEHLLQGQIISCGCIKTKRTIARNKKHGLYNDNKRLFDVWNNMIQRCENSKNNSFGNYGKRGIKVCREWHDLKTFIDWAKSSGYEERDKNNRSNVLSIERIDVNGNYEPNNCKWIPVREQAWNKRNSKMCRKEAGRVKHILDYGLELENVKENELPDKDNEIIIQFNNILSEKYGLFEVDVLENDNLYFRGRITSNTKSENNAKLKLLIAELNEFYKKYNLKKVIKSMIAYGHTI